MITELYSLKVKHIARVRESGLLEKIENKKKEAYEEAFLNFGFFPAVETRRTYEESYYDYNYFDRKADWWRVEYYQRNFCIVPKEDGVYWEFWDCNNLEKKRKINPYRITEREIHKWFGLLVKR